MELKRAQRKKVKLKIGVSAASGFGKTYSALLLAYGITNDWTKIAVIDSENESASLYEHLGPYLVINLKPPFTPERYIEAMDLCITNGIEVCIIDSNTHEWDGTGGCLSMHSDLGGRYQDWAKVTPRHTAYIQKILQSPIHVITTTRRKQDYELANGSSGKLEVTKIGTKEVTREGFEYELTLNFEIINDKHLARASKDRTGLFDGVPEFLITPETGKQLVNWANSGVDIEKYTLDCISKLTNKAELETLWARDHALAVEYPSVKKAFGDANRKFSK